MFPTTPIDLKESTVQDLSGEDILFNFATGEHELVDGKFIAINKIEALKQKEKFR